MVSWHYNATDTALFEYREKHVHVHVHLHFFYYKALASNIKGEVDKSGQANTDNTEERGMRADEVGQPPPT